MREGPTPAEQRRRRYAEAVVHLCFRIVVISFFIVARVQTGKATPMSSLSNQAQTESEEDKLSEEINDPTAMLTQVRLFYTRENFRSSAQTNVALIQPIIPVARLSLLPVEQILRLSVKLRPTATSAGGHTVTGLSDIQLYDSVSVTVASRGAVEAAMGNRRIVRVRHRDRSQKRCGRVATWPGRRACVRGCTNLWLGILFENPHLSCPYAQRRDPAKWDVVSARVLIPIGSRLVRAVDRFDVDCQLAPGHTHYDSGEFWGGENLAT